MGLIDFFTKGGSVGMIARNQAYLYQRIINNYRNKFIDLKGILKAVAFINMSSYIKKGAVSMTQLNEVINGIVKNDKQDDLAYFKQYVFEMERIMFSIDKPSSVYVMDEDDKFRDIVEKNIEETIAKVNTGKLKRKMYDLAIYHLINNPQLHTLLGITS